MSQYKHVGLTLNGARVSDDVVEVYLDLPAGVHQKELQLKYRESDALLVVDGDPAPVPSPIRTYQQYLSLPKKFRDKMEPFKRIEMLDEKTLDGLLKDMYREMGIKNPDSTSDRIKSGVYDAAGKAVDGIKDHLSHEEPVYHKEFELRKEDFWADPDEEVRYLSGENNHGVLTLTFEVVETEQTE